MIDPGHGDDELRVNTFWTDLSARHTALLEQYGRDNFKRTVNQQYFNWGVLGIVRFQLGAVLRAWIRRPDLSVLSSRLEAAPAAAPDLFHPRGLSALIYRLHVAMLASVLRRNDPENLLGRFEEPALGDPVRVRYKGAALSQDLCHAVHEYYRIVEHLSRDEPATILEIGAGYGRLAYLFLRARPDTQYVIVDVPPARDLAAWYLSTCFPDMRIFPCRPDASPNELRDAFVHAQAIFLAPHQLAAVASKKIDVTVSISSLHEMSRAQVAGYFAEIDRITRGIFYSKQWRVSRVPSNNTVITEFEYPVPASWALLFHRKHPLLPKFFESCFRVL